MSHYLIVMLNVIILSVVMLNVMAPFPSLKILDYDESDNTLASYATVSKLTLNSNIWGQGLRLPLEGRIQLTNNRLG